MIKELKKAMPKELKESITMVSCQMEKKIIHKRDKSHLSYKNRNSRVETTITEMKNSLQRINNRSKL